MPRTAVRGWVSYSIALALVAGEFALLLPAFPKLAAVFGLVIGLIGGHITSRRIKVRWRSVVWLDITLCVCVMITAVYTGQLDWLWLEIARVIGG